jgi:hypothetical protein
MHRGMPKVNLKTHFKKNQAHAQSYLSRVFSWDVVDVGFPTCCTFNLFSTYNWLREQVLQLVPKMIVIGNITIELDSSSKDETWNIFQTVVLLEISLPVLMAGLAIPEEPRLKTH